MRFIVSGCCGFIGFHCCNLLLKQGHEVVGIDNINDYYSTDLKNHRLQILEQAKFFNFIKHDISKPLNLELNRRVDFFIHLAAQAGVRLPISDYYKYDLSNILGFNNTLNFIRNFHIKNFIFASSSSVYSGNIDPIFSEDDYLDPKSYYALTKLHNEKTAKLFSITNNINVVGLRFFTVYGPYGRPDMAYFSFLDSLYKDKEILLLNEGNMSRDMTYISDIVQGIMLCIDFLKTKEDIYEIFNLGNDQPIFTKDLLNRLEDISGNKSKIKMLDSKNEAIHTHADLSKSRGMLGYNPEVNFDDGIAMFHDWYKSYYFS